MKRDGASRVPFGGCWDAFHKEESPRPGILIRDSGPRGLGIRIEYPRPPWRPAGMCLDVARPKLRRGAGRARGLGSGGGAAGRAGPGEMEGGGGGPSPPLGGGSDKAALSDLALAGSLLR